jgi:hypothetical protein
MTGRGDGGFASTQFLCILLFITALAAGTGMCLAAYLRFEQRLRRENQDTARIEEILQSALADLYGDPSPDINDSGDPVWAWDGRAVEGYTVSVIPLSDRLNLNFVRKNLFEKTRLALLFRPGKTAADLQQFREDSGLSPAAEMYGEFFDREDLEQFFSVYGWANINLTDEFALRKLVLALTGSEYTAEYARGALQTLLISRKIAGRGDLRSIFGIYYEDIFPFINTEPLMNVNFIDETLLQELIAYPDYGITSPERRCEELLARRSGGGVNSRELRTVLGIDDANPLNQYLGCVTWFWEIAVIGNGRSGRTVVCRLPPEDAELLEKPIFTIIEQRFQ